MRPWASHTVSCLARPLHLGLAATEFSSPVASSSLQFPGWSQGPEGSLVIALGNEDALGEYSCTPYNSLGTAGPSPVTRVLLKVTLRVGQQRWVRRLGICGVNTGLAWGW